LLPWEQTPPPQQSLFRSAAESAVSRVQQLAAQSAPGCLAANRYSQNSFTWPFAHTQPVFGMPAQAARGIMAQVTATDRMRKKFMAKRFEFAISRRIIGCTTRQGG
jgi:hypothetical protein